MENILPPPPSISPPKVPPSKPIKLYILTPCYGGVVHVNYTICLMNTMKYLTAMGIDHAVEFISNDSLVTRARNNLIARAMMDPHMTHCIFIDSDIVWKPKDIVSLLKADKDVIGGLYPLKRYHWEKVVDKPVSDILARKQGSILESQISDVDMIQANLLGYNFNVLQKQVAIENNLTSVRHVATGFMMISRGAIESMMNAYPDTKYRDDIGCLSKEEEEFAYALFNCGVIHGQYLSEDWLFCDRWRNIGGHVYVDVTIALTHSGVHDYKGNFLASIVGYIV